MSEETSGAQFVAPQNPVRAHHIGMSDTPDAQRGVFVDWRIILGVLGVLVAGGGIGTVVTHQPAVPVSVVETLATKESVNALTSKIDDLGKKIEEMGRQQAVANDRASSVAHRLEDHEERLRALESGRSRR